MTALAGFVAFGQSTRSPAAIAEASCARVADAATRRREVVDDGEVEPAFDRLDSTLEALEMARSELRNITPPSAGPIDNGSDNGSPTKQVGSSTRRERASGTAVGGGGAAKEEDMPTISKANILIIATDGFEDSELLEPRKRLIETGATVVLASPDTREIKGDKGATITPDRRIDEIDIEHFDALLLPGGTKNPDKLRMNETVVEAVRAFVDSRRPVAAICHGPWLLAEADVLRGRTVTSWPSIRTDLRNAGANVVDQEAVTDGSLVTSRKPEDIPAFTRAFIEAIETVRAPAEAV